MRAYEDLVARAEEFATLITLEMGKPLEQARAEVTYAAEFLRWYGEEAPRTGGGFRELPDGSYELRVPYSSSRELLMDVLRYGPDAEIIAPAPLREEAAISLKLALGAYES